MKRWAEYCEELLDRTAKYTADKLLRVSRYRPTKEDIVIATQMLNNRALIGSDERQTEGTEGINSI